MAGLGISAFPLSTVTGGMRVLGVADGYPEMPDAEVALFTRADEKSVAVEAFEKFVLDYAGERWSPASI